MNPEDREYSSEIKNYDGLMSYLNANREVTITLDLNDLVDKALKYLDYIYELVEEKSNKKLSLPSYHIGTEDIVDNSFVYLCWDKGSHSLILNLYQDYDFARYDYWNTDKTSDWCHYDHLIGSELAPYVLDTLLLFTEDEEI